MGQGIIARVNVSDGQGVDPVDVNNVSLRNRAQIIDAMLMQAARLTPTGVATPGPGVFAYGAAGSPYAPSSGHIANRAGTIFFKEDNTLIDGATPMFLAYYLDDQEINYAIATPDPSNPRYDGVFVRIDEVSGGLESRNWQDAGGTIYTTENLPTTYVTRLRTQYVQGTAAGSPALPATPVGYLPLYYVLVPAAWGGGTAGKAMIHDCRIPVGQFRRCYIPAFNFALQATPWTLFSGAFSSRIGAPGASAITYAVCPVQNARVLGFGFTLQAGAVTATPVRLNGAGTETAVGPAGVALSGGAWGDSVVRPPLWSNGRMAMDQADADFSELLALKLQDNGAGTAILTGAWFDIAC